MTPLYQAPHALTAWLGRCLPSPLHLLQPPPPLCYILLFSPLSPSLFNLSLLCFTLFFYLSAPTLSFPSTPFIISSASQPPLFYLHSVNNFAFVLFFLQSFFFSPKHLSWHCITCYGEREACYRGTFVGQTKRGFHLSHILSYVSACTPLLFKCGYQKCLVLS